MTGLYCKIANKSKYILVFKYVLRVAFILLLLVMMYDIIFGDYSYEGDDNDDEVTMMYEIFTGHSGVALDVHSKGETRRLNNSTKTKKKIDHKKANVTLKKEFVIYNKEKYHNNAKQDKEVVDVSGNVNNIYKSEERRFYHAIAEQDEDENDGISVENSADKGNERKKLEESIIAILNSNTLDVGSLSNLHGDEASDLIINTYMRSGSTFLGKFFSMRSDTFYVFEPLWYIQKFAYFNGMHQTCHYFRHHCSRPGTSAVIGKIGSSVKVSQALDFLRGLLDCNFKHHKSFLPDSKHFPKEFPHNHSWNFAKGQAWNWYFDCSKRHGSTYDGCFKEMRPVCRSKKHKVFKVLRSTVDNFESLLNERKHLRVIHLFRDPRGIINSHLHTAFLKNRLPDMRDVQLDVETLCDRMRVDIRSALHLQRVYKDQFLIVQYEDFDDILYNAKTLYNFMNMDLPPKLVAALENLKNSKDDSRGFHPYSYTKSLSWTVATMVQKHCQGVLKALGYPEFKSRHEMHKFGEESYKPKLPFSLSNRT